MSRHGLQARPINDRSEPVALLGNPKVRFHRVAGPAIDRQYVLRTRGEGDHDIHFRAQPHVAARPRIGWRGEVEFTALLPRNIHEQVERAWHARGCQPELSQPSYQVVSAVVVMSFNPQEGITVAIAGCHEGVVYST